MARNVIETTTRTNAEGGVIDSTVTVRSTAPVEPYARIMTEHIQTELEFYNATGCYNNEIPKVATIIVALALCAPSLTRSGWVPLNEFYTAVTMLKGGKACDATLRTYARTAEQLGIYMATPNDPWASVISAKGGYVSSYYIDFVGRAYDTNSIEKIREEITRRNIETGKPYTGSYATIWKILNAKARNEEVPF